MDLALHALGQAATSEKELEAIQQWLNQKKNANND
jgi:hypothetical protein